MLFHVDFILSVCPFDLFVGAAARPVGSRLSLYAKGCLAYLLSPNRFAVPAPRVLVEDELLDSKAAI